MKQLLQKLHNRALPFLLAVLMLASSLPLNVISLGTDSALSAGTPAPDGYIYDYDTLEITLNGEEISAMQIYSHEKITISADGVAEEATYQWQIQHNENENTWINIYDATSKELPVSLALVGNLLRADNTAKLRCRAYTEDYAYLTSPVTVTVTDPAETTVTTPTQTKQPATFAAEGDASDNPEFVTVTINYVKYGYVYDLEKNDYVLQMQGEAFSPYVATLVYNGSLTTSVNNPTIVGFDPFVGDSETSQSAVEIDLANVKEDVTYTVNYKPAQVPYEVHYLFQGIYDDLYVEDSTVIGTNEKNEPITGAIYEGTGVTGLQPEDGVEGITFQGFTSLYYQPDTIAADGSTVFEVYFERNYYLMEFDCNGGYGVNTVYVRYGTYISIPYPIRAGYVFDSDGDGNGWDLIETEQQGYTGPLADGNADPLPSHMPPYNSSYKAIWERTATTYTVVYWAENANDTDYSYWGSVLVGGTKNAEGEIVLDGSVTSADLVSGADHFAAPTSLKDYKYFTYNEELTLLKESERDDLKDGKVIVEGDGSTIVNVYYDRKDYTLRFYYAATTGTGTDTDDDGVADSFDSVKIIGGSTYSFGASGTNTSKDATLLDNIFKSDQVGTVTKLPQLNATGKARNYTLGTLESNKISYHYIEFTAAYGQDISELWPCAVFESATRTDANTHGKWSGKEAFVSAWNGEHHVYYSQHNENQTIKGKYEKLDDQLLFDPKYPDEAIVSFLCFWENGANIHWSIPELYRYNIYLQVYPGMDTTGKTIVTRDGVQFYFKESYDTVDDSDAAHQTQPSLTGYSEYFVNSGLYGYKYSPFEYRALTSYDTKLYSSAFELNFYYKCVTSKLSFFNHNASMDGVGGDSVAYGTPLSDMFNISDAEMESKHYPVVLEPGAYEFAGWYKTPAFIPGTEVDWSKDTMPDGDLTVYAKWVPVTRNVTFYHSYDKLVADDPWQPDPDDPITYPIPVPHGKLLGTTYHMIPTWEGYEFVGWFYFDENGRKKFAPDSMAVTRDLDLFAEWKSATPTTYEITYQAWKIVDGVDSVEDGKIADPIYDYSTAGKTVTFQAKAGTLLYEKYQTGWFPASASHSILMNADSANNKYTFKYYNKEYINYKIVYKNRVTGEIFEESDPIRTTESIVSVKYKPFEGYYPEQYYIQRAIAYDPVDYDEFPDHVSEENILYFYYVPDDEHAPFHVKHHKQNLDGTYTEAESEQGIADLEDAEGNPTVITANAKSYNGYKFARAEVTSYEENEQGEWDATTKTIKDINAIKGVLSIGGLEIKIYYDRIPVGYTVQYVEYGTTNVLHADTGEGLFGATITHTALAVFPEDPKEDDLIYIYIDGSDASEEQRTKQLEIRVNSADNVLIFYYNLKKIQVNYHVVCTVPSLAENNRVSLANERAATPSGLAGSKAMSGIGFQFVGWYYDEACTQAVPSEWVTKKDGYYELKPKAIVEDTDGEEHFYALFEPIYGNLQINKTVAGGEGDSGDTFLFRVKGKDHNNEHIDIIVSITDASPNVDTVLLNKVPIGNYTVTELTDWSWEYTTGTEECTAIVEKDETTEVSFTNNSTPSNWLSDETVNENQFD